MIEQRPFFNLLDESFPGMMSNIKRCEQIGFPWASKPFLKKENGKVLSHIGVIEYPLFIEGQQYKSCGLHAVCTRASHRGQGLASELIQEALKWTKEHYNLVVLFTEIPKFYEKHSFSYVQEYRFHLRCQHPKGSQPLTPVVSPKDDVLFRRCFHSRTPLSNDLYVKDDGTIASFNTLFATFPTYWSLHYSQSIEGILSFEIKDKTLHLYDIIAEKIPSLDLILDHLPSAIDEIYFYFSPDRLTDTANPQPYLYDHGHLMVHGTWPGTKPFMIQPTSRC